MTKLDSNITREMAERLLEPWSLQSWSSWIWTTWTTFVPSCSSPSMVLGIITWLCTSRTSSWSSSLIFLARARVTGPRGTRMNLNGVSWFVSDLFYKVILKLKRSLKIFGLLCFPFYLLSCKYKLIISSTPEQSYFLDQLFIMWSSRKEGKFHIELKGVS